MLLCFHEAILIVLHGFIKKTQKTPEADLELARGRMREVTG
jgi:phage-related protein